MFLLVHVIWCTLSHSFKIITIIKIIITKIVIIIMIIIAMSPEV